MTTSARSRRNALPQMELFSTSSPAASRAKTSASPAEVLAWLAHVPASGAITSDSSEKHALDWSLLKTWLRCAAEAATKSPLTWSVRVSPSGLSWWVLPMPERTTTAHGHSLLPTLAARDYRHPNAPGGISRGKRPPKSGKQLPNALGGPINPEWAEWFMGFPAGWTELSPSETQSVRKSRRLSAARSSQPQR